MQQIVPLSKPCQRFHQKGRQEVNFVCLNKNCLFRLSCINCLGEGQHKDHLNDLCPFEYLGVRLKNEIDEYDEADILALINQKKQEFKDATADILQTLDLLETEFLKQISRIIEANKSIQESFQMIENNDFLQFNELQARAMVELQEKKLKKKIGETSRSANYKSSKEFQLIFKEKIGVRRHK